MNETTRSVGTRWVCWVLFGGLVLTGCDGGGSAGEGVREVTVFPEALHTQATPDIVARVADLQPAANGLVWILNSVEPYFVVLGAEGQSERAFGRRGGGPQEFGVPLALVRGGESGDVWTYDVRRSALIRISPGERRELELSPDSLPPSSLISFKGAGINQAPPWLESAQDGFHMARSRSSLRETALQTWTADILLLTPNGPEASAALHTPIADLVGDPASRYGGATTLLPYPVWTVCADGTVGLYDPLANALRHMSRDGQELAAFVLPEERRAEITVERVFEMFYRQLAENLPAHLLPDKDEARRLTQEQNEELVSTSAGVFPEYVDMHCTPDGTFWLRPFDVTAVRLGQGSEWIRITEDGSQWRIALPSGFRTFRIESDRIWGTVQDALGVESIAWLEVASIR